MFLFFLTLPGGWMCQADLPLSKVKTVGGTAAKLFTIALPLGGHMGHLGPRLR